MNESLLLRLSQFARGTQTYVRPLREPQLLWSNEKIATSELTDTERVAKPTETPPQPNNPDVFRQQAISYDMNVSPQVDPSEVRDTEFREFENTTLDSHHNQPLEENGGEQAVNGVSPAIETNTINTPNVEQDVFGNIHIDEPDLSSRQIEPSPMPADTITTQYVENKYISEVVAQPLSINESITLQPRQSENKNINGEINQEATQPSINVTIERIDIRAVKENPVKTTKKKSTQQTKMSLADYMTARSGGTR